MCCLSWLSLPCVRSACVVVEGGRLSSHVAPHVMVSWSSHTFAHRHASVTIDASHASDLIVDLIDLAMLNGVKHTAERHGAISALGQVVGRNLREGQGQESGSMSASGSGSGSGSASATTVSTGRGLTHALLQRCVGLLFARLTEQSSDACLAACESLAVLCRLCVLPLPVGEVKTPAAGAVDAPSAPVTPPSLPPTSVSMEASTAPPPTAVPPTAQATDSVSRLALVKLLRLLVHSPVDRASEEDESSKKNSAAAPAVSARRRGRHDVVEAAALTLGALAWHDPDTSVRQAAVKVRRVARAFVWCVVCGVWGGGGGGGCLVWRVAHSGC